MAHILFHYPFQNLLKRIINENIDGSQLIASLIITQHNTNAFHIVIADETGWNKDEARQILSILFRHHTCTRSEFARNFDRVWAKKEYSVLSPHIYKIKDTLLGHKVEEIHYKIKHAQPIDEFSDCIINMVDEMNQMIDDTKNEDISYDESDSIKYIYEGIAECFIFYP
eukprot:261610_1